MKKVVLFLFACIVNSENNLFAQAGIVRLDSFATDGKANKLQALVAVYQYKGQPFEDPFLNGIESRDVPHTFFARLPDLKGVRDTSYAFIYFGGIAGNKNLPGYVFAIIANNTRNEKPCRIWIDRNYNLDLTDDGAPESFLFNTKYKDITFRHPAIREASYTTRISRFPFQYNAKYMALLDDYYKENSGDKIFSGAFYSFREERMNIRSGDYKNGNDSFRIALKDMNCNGLYNEPGIDILITGNYKSALLSDNKILIASKISKTYFERMGKHYDVAEIDSFGCSLVLRLDENAPIKNSLVAGKKLQKFKFASIEKEKKNTSIRKFRRKPVYIYVWRFGSDGFGRDTAALRQIALNYSGKVNIVTLNYGETPKELKLFKRRNNINWLIGLSSTSINQKLFIETYPTGILANKKLRIRQIGLSPTELLNLLQNNTF